MLLKCFVSILLIFLKVKNLDSSLLLWATKEIQVPALQIFTNEDLEGLVEKLGYPRIMAFKGVSETSKYNFNKIYNVYYSAFILNETVVLESVNCHPEGEEKANLTKMEMSYWNSTVESEENTLLIFTVVDTRRGKREIDYTTEIAERPPPTEETGQVVYWGIDTNNKTGAIVYSSSLLLLRINSTIKYIGKPMRTTMSEKKSSFVKLTVSIVKDAEKLILHFLFPYKTTGYWSLENIEIEFAQGNKVTLTTRRDILAPNRFSYHCPGETKFTDQNETVELTMYDFQIQMGDKTDQFGDAYDCVPFTTGPIWSGLFVTFILVIVLAIALNAIGAIKTMDKFENHKSRQLTITLFE